MAQVQIYYWKDIPYGVRARDANGRVSKQLPRAFEATVDAAAIADEQTSASDYQAGFVWGEMQEREGTAEEVAEAVVAEVVAAYPAARLAKLARRQTE